MKRGYLTVVGALAALLCLAAWRLQPRAMLAAYLAVWWFWIGTLLGGLANVWLHNLTGGRWGEAIRVPLLRSARSIWIAALLFAPVLLGLHQLYPWAASAPAGALRWTDELSSPGFKNWWLTPVFFTVRSIVYLLVWCVLAQLSRRRSLVRAKPFSALALIIYGFTAGLAAVDWVMSLMPLWYSSVFGWLVGVGQMLGGMALGIACAAFGSRRAAAPVFADLGNLLLMYVMTWAYLAFSQFLIIWAENLPHEIIWYAARRQGPWPALAWLLALGMFAAPLLILLVRAVKQTPRLLGRLAVALQALQALNTCWLVLPSLPVATPVWLWTAAPAAILFASIALWLWRHLPHAVIDTPHIGQEVRHV